MVVDMNDEQVPKLHLESDILGTSVVLRTSNSKRLHETKMKLTFASVVSSMNG
jgi:hypothetical protein